ncbi:glucose-1-phosphate adenylyltransferase subunit GlgD [Bengtsoniella intestinalis]|uniref:glucose-1-phosphate adenylyltransferase subunit GlgD n=1 Tax=Bengtsoniella intestinalis TaxID=3073143 RepID=UPI00391FB535
MKSIHGIIFSYQRENSLKELGESRASASVPFGGRYRAVDFPLSAMVNAGAMDVGVVLQGKYQSILDHLGTGKDWDLSRKRGGMKVLPMFDYQSKLAQGDFRGRLDALVCVRSYLASIRQSYVVLMDGDLVANLPLRDIVDSHIASGADITCVCGNDSFYTENGTYFDIDDNGKVKDVAYNLHRPRGYRGLETYVISTKLLLQLVDDAASHDQVLWRKMLSDKSNELNIRSYLWSGFAAQVRTVQEYYNCSMQILQADIRSDLFNKSRPIRAKGADMASAYIAPSAECASTLIPDGCFIEGIVENSVLFPGVIVEEGASVSNCILFKGCVVRKGAKLSYLIADKYVDVSEGCNLRGNANYPIVISKGSKV